MAAEKRGSIAFFSTYRPPVPLDIYSSRLDLQVKPDPYVFQMTDGKDYNYNGQSIPSAALKKLLKSKLASKGTEAHVDSGSLSGMIFVSERGHLETLYIALRYRDNPELNEVMSLSDIFGTSDFNGVRMEDSGCFAGDYLIYVSTKEVKPPPSRRQPWTAVYKTNLITGKTDRLTPEGEADLSPSVSRSGKQILVASFKKKGGWHGEIEDLQTDIFVMNTEEPYERKFLVKNGGWPTWPKLGSDNVIFFHRKDSPKKEDPNKKFWGVYRFDISNNVETLVTPEEIDAITPAAIDDTRVAVATIREKSKLSETKIRTEAQYRHIEVFDSNGQESIKLTQPTRSKADHFNPFVIDASMYTLHIGYHRCRNNLVMEKEFQQLHSPKPDVDLLRVSGVFPSFNKDGSMLAFVDNEFKSVWVVDKDGLLHLVYLEEGPDRVWSPIWNQNPEKDTLYVCVGPSFSQTEIVEIHSICNVSRFGPTVTKQLTKGFNSAFPSSSPDGNFRSLPSYSFPSTKSIFSP